MGLQFFILALVITLTFGFIEQPSASIVSVPFFIMAAYYWMFRIVFCSAARFLYKNSWSRKEREHFASFGVFRFSVS